MDSCERCTDLEAHRDELREENDRLMKVTKEVLEIITGLKWKLEDAQ